MIFPETTDKKIICPTCEGSGMVSQGNLRENHNHDTATCPDCAGLGMLRKITSIEYKKINQNGI